MHQHDSPNLKQLFLSCSHFTGGSLYVYIYGHKIVQAIFSPQLRLPLCDTMAGTPGVVPTATTWSSADAFVFFPTHTGALYDDSYILLHISAYKSLLEINSAAFCSICRHSLRVPALAAADRAGVALATEQGPQQRLGCRRREVGGNEGPAPAGRCCHGFVPWPGKLVPDKRPPLFFSPPLFSFSVVYRT